MSRSQRPAVFGFMIFFLAFGCSAANSTAANQMKVLSNGSRPTLNAPVEHFTGKVRIDPLFQQPLAPQRATGSYVTFEPGARSDWHTHPVGQTLVITAGTGWVQEWGGIKHTVHPGDVVQCPPGVKHWHGATGTNGMTHLAIQENSDQGKNVDWMEKVSDEVYHSQEAGL